MTRRSQIVTSLILAAITLTTAALLSISANGDHHAADEKAPPKAGQVAKDFTLKNVDGADVKLSAITAKSNVALIFMRGFPGYQCPICNRQFGELLTNAEKIAEAGGSVVLIYPGAIANLDEKAKEFIRGRSMPENFFFLIDPDYSSVNAYNIRWDAPNETAYPSTFIMDSERKVSFAKVSDGHGGRTNASQVIDELKKIQD